MAVRWGEMDHPSPWFKVSSSGGYRARLDPRTCVCLAHRLGDIGRIPCPVGDRRRACPEHEAAFELALQLEPPWRVVSSDLDFARRRVDLRLGFRAGSRFPCPQCGRACQAIEFTEGTWRQPDMMAFEAFVTARLPSIRCPEHGDVALMPPWASDHVSLQALIRDRNTGQPDDTSRQLA